MEKVMLDSDADNEPEIDEAKVKIDEPNMS